MKKYFISVFNGKTEIPLDLKEGQTVNLTDYAYRTIKPDQLQSFQMLLANDPAYSLLFELLKRGFEIHVWHRK